MKTPFLTAERLTAESLGFAQDEFHAADALADAALEAVADFCGRMKVWRREEVQILAELNARAEAAESRRRHAHDKLLWELCRCIQQANPRHQRNNPDHR